MNRDEFTRAFDELVECYGDRAFPAEMRMRIWRFAEPLHFGDFVQVLEHVIDESPRTPTPGTIKRACMPLLRKVSQAKMAERIRTLEEAEDKCEYCASSGFITVLLRENPAAEFSFRCNRCGAAAVRRLSQSIPVWSDELRGKYAPFSFREESFTTAMKVQRAAARVTGNPKPENLESANETLRALGYEHLIKPRSKEC